MPRAINSFDVFDTLLGRRSVEPERVLHHLEARANLPGLAAHRAMADRRLGSRAQPYCLLEIWQEVGRELSLDGTTIDRLLAMEIQLEHQEVIPIADNLALVRDGDLLVSDTYLPREVVLSLLHKVGMDRKVGLALSNDGKFRGWIWRQLKSMVNIHEHLGDNVHSDGKMASEVGIRAIIYHASRRTAVEQTLVEKGWRALANLIREVRLANPFPPSRSHERTLWNLACQLNFPLLYFASLILERHAQAIDANDIFFVSRDCELWRKLFGHLFPKRRSVYLFTSRRCLIKPTESYLQYFMATWHPGGIVVDLLSTGASWSKLFARLGNKAQCFFIGYIDNFAYLPDAQRPQDGLAMESVVRASELRVAASKGIEMLNYAMHPMVEDVLALPGGGHLPVLVDLLEYDPALPAAAHKAFGACVDALAHYPELASCGTQEVDGLVKFFARLICEDRQLFAIYPGHFEADAAYERSLMT